LSERSFDLILLDSGLQSLGNVDLAEQIRELQRKAEILVVSLSHRELDQPATSEPAEDSVLSAPRFDQIIESVDKALMRPLQQNGVARKSAIKSGNVKEHAGLRISSDLPPGTALIGKSSAMTQLFKTIERIAPIDCNVLITGATGTGKELVARAIHDRSARRKGPFVDVNSSAIPETLFEAEFFGHQRGTFTGAYDTRTGLFERASGGTLFLDEVDSLSLASQAKLLRVLQERQLRRVGGRENIPVDVRIMAATGSNLKAAIASGKFRADLYFRLRVVPLHVPLLRDRSEDIPLLLDHFLSAHAQRTGYPERRFSLQAMRALTEYNWPGNVRELENIVEYALAIGGDEELTIDDLPADVFGAEANDLDESNTTHIFANLSLAEVERRHILAVFQQCGRHHNKAAAALRIDRRTLYRKLQQYNVELTIKSA
jgi:DNA-binding NtrC family response regulator